MKKLFALLALVPALAFGQYYGPPYNPAAVAITGGTISGLTSVAATGNGTFGTAISSFGLVSVGDNNNGNSALRLFGGASQKGWQVGSNITTVNGLEFTPATAGGGTTFTTPTMTLVPGQVLAADGTAAAPSYSFSGNSISGMYRATGFTLFSANGSPALALSNSFAELPFNFPIQWSSTTDATATADLKLFRDAPGTLAQRNGVNAQSFKAANTYTDPSNYEYGVFDWQISPGFLTIGTIQLGTGVGRGIRFRVAGTDVLSLQGNGGGLSPISAGSYALGSGNLGFSKLYIDYTNTGAVGPVTINKAKMRVNIAAATASLVVTDSLVTAAATVGCYVSQNDATAQIKNVVPAAGSFTINMQANATATTSIDCVVTSGD